MFNCSLRQNNPTKYPRLKTKRDTGKDTFAGHNRGKNRIESIRNLLIFYMRRVLQDIKLIDQMQLEVLYKIFYFSNSRDKKDKKRSSQQPEEHLSQPMYLAMPGGDHSPSNGRKSSSIRISSRPPSG